MVKLGRGAVVLTLCGACVLAAAGGALAAKGRRGHKSMELTSAAFKAKASIPKRHSCEGEDLSPALSWTGLPPKTQSLALIVDDPDAPPGTWVHWVLYDLPAGLKGLEEGVAKTESLPDGAKQGLCWGVDEFDRVGYYGPCPPPGKPHRYFFKLYALDKKPGLPAGATKDQLLAAMKGHVLGQAELIGLYQR